MEEIAENPYFQYFIGLPGFRQKAPFVPSLMVEFRKRLTDDVLSEINEMILDDNHPDDPNPPGDDDSGSQSSSEAASESPESNAGTMILDATCAPQNIEFPQDINLLNESRENLAHMVDETCYLYNWTKPRMYRRNARRDCLNLIRSRKRTSKRIRRAIKKQRQYIRRDRDYLGKLLADGCERTEKLKIRLVTIDKAYEQQRYMYDNNVRKVPDRIVSISQPSIRPIVRGKAATPVEFGAKLDLSLDERGMARIEKLSFDPYNESDVLIMAAMRYCERTGHFPERILADKIYWNRANLRFCRERGIRLSGPPLGRPKKDPRADRKLEYTDNADRIEMERSFAAAKHSDGLGLIRTKPNSSTRSSIQLSVIALNVNHLMAVLLCAKFIWAVSRVTRRMTQGVMMVFMVQTGEPIELAHC